MQKRIVLFDIDGTLIRGEGLGPKLFLETFERVFETGENLSKYSFAGGTDFGMLQTIVTGMGYDISDEVRGHFYDELIDSFKKELSDGERKFHPIEGVENLLVELNSDENVQLGLVTGNIEPTAWLKLKNAGLDQFFRFGAFGSRTAVRAKMIQEAVQRIEDFSGPVSSRNIFYLGDTPTDVQAAIACDIRSGAVATGRFQASDLKEAECCLENFSNLDRVKEFLYSE